MPAISFIKKQDADKGKQALRVGNTVGIDFSGKKKQALCVNVSA